MRGALFNDDFIEIHPRGLPTSEIVGRNGTGMDGFYSNVSVACVIDVDIDIHFVRQFAEDAYTVESFTAEERVVLIVIAAIDINGTWGSYRHIAVG